MMGLVNDKEQRERYKQRERDIAADRIAESLKKIVRQIFDMRNDEAMRKELGVALQRLQRNEWAHVDNKMLPNHRSYDLWKEYLGHLNLAVSTLEKML